MLSREDILAHAYAQCRSNKGAPGVDGQDFEDIEAYGGQRWLGELALALRQETYRPDPIRRVFIPKVNGKLRPLGISTLRDRVIKSVSPISFATCNMRSTPVTMSSRQICAICWAAPAGSVDDGIDSRQPHSGEFL
ncbi:MAG: hypothetical protein ACLP4V_31480 [Methylocella sp.]